jgi:hypothetical protein
MSTGYTPDTRIAIGPHAEPVEAAPRDGLTYVGKIRITSNGKRSIARQMLLEGSTVLAAAAISGLPRATVATICTGLVRVGKRAPRLHSPAKAR